jgi:methyl-accepting chemotaxis protein
VNRTGLSIEMKIVLLLVGALLVQDVILVVMFFAGARPTVMLVALGVTLLFAVAIAAAWAGGVTRAIDALSRACFAARKGDTRVLTVLPRSDELRALNDEINELVAVVRDVEELREQVELESGVARRTEESTPDLLHASQELLVSLKELSEGAGAQGDILRRIATALQEMRLLVEGIAGPGGEDASDAAQKLRSLGTLARDAEGLADNLVDEVTRPSLDEAAIARTVNGLRDVARTMADVALQAAGPLERHRSSREAAGRALSVLERGDAARADAARVAQLMERSAGGGFRAATRLASVLRRIGIELEARGHMRRD